MDIQNGRNKNNLNNILLTERYTSFTLPVFLNQSQFFKIFIAALFGLYNLKLTNIPLKFIISKEFLTFENYMFN